MQVNRLFKEDILNENRLLVLESIVLRQMFGPNVVSRVWWSKSGTPVLTERLVTEGS